MASRPSVRSFSKALPLLVAPAMVAACGLSFDALPTTTPVDAGERDTGADTSVDAAKDQSAPDVFVPDSGLDAADGNGIPDSGPDVAPVDSGPACNDAQPAANEITVATSTTFPFKASYTPVFLGAVPGGKKLGACAVEGDSLVVAYDVGTPTASLQRIPLVRTCDGSHVSSIGVAAKIVDAPGIDLGFLSNPYAYVPTRVASATPFPYFECANGAATCTKSFDFTTGDAAATALSLALLPDIGNAMKLRAYASLSANMYSVDNAAKTLTKLDTLTAFPVTQPVAVSANSPVFGARYAISPVESQNKISFLQIDNDGGLVKPSVGQNTGFATTSIALRGACQDPATGDVIFTAYDGSGRIDSIKGFAKP
jgi:hypothetical protein